MRRVPRGCHQFLGLIACNRCGHKQPHTAEGVDDLRLHTRDCQPELFHNHITRDIKPYGTCPQCDEYLKRQAMRQKARQYLQDPAEPPETPGKPAEAREADETRP